MFQSLLLLSMLSRKCLFLVCHCGHGMRLKFSLCFVIGAPWDQQEREEKNMQANGLQETLGGCLYACGSK